MFQVFYNHKTREIYTTETGIVVDCEDCSVEFVKQMANNGYSPINVVDNRFTFYDENFNDVFDRFFLVYSEHFCCCDICGELYLQDELTFTDDGAPLCSKCYKENEGTIKVHILIESGRGGNYHINDKPRIIGVYPADITNQNLIEKTLQVLRERRCWIDNCYKEDNELEKLITDFVNTKETSQVFICGMVYNIECNVEIPK